MSAPWGYLYETKNKANGKMYVGIKKCCGGRAVAGYIGSGKLLMAAVSKHGRRQFATRVLEFAATKGILCELEKAAIAHYRSQHGAERMYNIADGGLGGGGSRAEQSARLKAAYRDAESRGMKIGFAGLTYEQRIEASRKAQRTMRLAGTKVGLAALPMSRRIEIGRRIAAARKPPRVMRWHAPRIAREASMERYLRGKKAWATQRGQEAAV